MRKSVERSLGFGVMLGLFACGLALVSRAVADEPPKCLCPQAAAHEVGVPMLSKIPYVSRLFKNVGIRTSPCADGKCPGEAVESIEHVGIEIAVCADEPAGAWKVCPVNGECRVAVTSVCACPGECCPEGKCACAGPASMETNLWERIIELSAGQAAAEAALDARQATLESSAEMLETLAGLHAENARLEAKLEAQAETHKVAEQLIELAAENARLKAQVELAEAKAEVMRATVEMTVENERLKMRLAEVESGATGKPARTAARPRAEKKPR